MCVCSCVQLLLCNQLSVRLVVELWPHCLPLPFSLKNCCAIIQAKKLLPHCRRCPTTCCNIVLYAYIHLFHIQYIFLTFCVEVASCLQHTTELSCRLQGVHVASRFAISCCLIKVYNFNVQR